MSPCIRPGRRAPIVCIMTTSTLWTSGASILTERRETLQGDAPELHAWRVLLPCVVEAELEGCGEGAGVRGLGWGCADLLLPACEGDACEGMVEGLLAMEEELGGEDLGAGEVHEGHGEVVYHAWPHALHHGHDAGGAAA
eukprot:767227-Hanusia_phi.AAC.5